MKSDRAASKEYFSGAIEKYLGLSNKISKITRARSYLRRIFQNVWQPPRKSNYGFHCVHTMSQNTHFRFL